MPCIFKSAVTGDLTLLSESAEKILSIMGKQPTPTGIITSKQIDHALLMLQQAIAVEKRGETASSPPAKDNFVEKEDAKADGWADNSISLKQRAWSFINMLEACNSSNTDIIWLFTLHKHSE